MWAESRVPNVWAWIVSVLFLLLRSRWGNNQDNKKGLKISPFFFTLYHFNVYLV